MTSPLGAGISNNDTTSVTVSGDIVQLDAALATLTDTDTVAPSDVIGITATDSLGGTAVAASIAVSVTSAPVIVAPTAATVGVNQPSPVGIITLSEPGSAPTATFDVTIADTNGLLAATVSGANAVGGSGTTSLTIDGTLTDINATLLTLKDTDHSTAPDTITVNATDQANASATPASVAVTVASPPVLTAPGSAILGQNYPTRIDGVSLAETNAGATETFTVVLRDTTGLISVGNNFGGTVTGNGSTSVTVSGTLGQVADNLQNELAVTESSITSDALTVNATDGFGNVSSQQTISLTVNGTPVITAPANETAGVSKPLAINGVSLVETGNTTNETFFMTLADTNGLLSVTSNPLGAGIGGAGTTTLGIDGSLAQVNAAVANLSDTDATLAPDTITVNATDSLDNTSGVGNAAAQQSIAVAVVNGPVIEVQGTQVIGVNKSATITGVSVSEANASGSETFTATLADAHGDLSATASVGASVGGSGTNSLTIAGTLAEVNATLATLQRYRRHSGVGSGHGQRDRSVWLHGRHPDRRRDGHRIAGH